MHNMIGDITKVLSSSPVCITAEQRENGGMTEDDRKKSSIFPGLPSSRFERAREKEIFPQ